MKFLFVLLTMGIFTLACAPNNNAAEPIKGSQVDEASYNAMVDVKWCQPLQNREQNFVISWIFDKNATARWEKRIIDNQQVIQNQKVNWYLQNKTLVVKDQISGLVILQKDISVEYDITSARKIMKWMTPSTNQCSGAPGSCSSQISEAMILSECQ